MKKGDIIGSRRITKVLKEFPVLFSGWEMDNIGYVVEHERVDKKNKNEKKRVGWALSGHGIFQIIDDDEFIKEKILEYTKVLSTTRVALELKTRS